MPVGSKSRYAFTLLELLLVLMLIGVSAAAIVPSLNGTLDRWQLRETARNLQSTLQVASQWAGVRQQAVTFVLDPKKGLFRLRTPDGGRSADPELFLTASQSFGQGLRIARIAGFKDAGTEKVLEFRPDGTSDVATIILTGVEPGADGRTVWQITTDNRGAVLCRERLADEVFK